PEDERLHRDVGRGREERGRIIGAPADQAVLLKRDECLEHLRFGHSGAEGERGQRRRRRVEQCLVNLLFGVGEAERPEHAHRLPPAPPVHLRLRCACVATIPRPVPGRLDASGLGRGDRSAVYLKTMSSARPTDRAPHSSMSRATGRWSVEERVVTTGMRARLTTVSAAVVMLVGSLGVAVMPAVAPRVPCPGYQRADGVHSHFRVATAAPTPHEHDEAIVVLDAHPDLAPLSGDRQAVVTALKRTAAATQAPVAALVEQQGGRVVNRFWLRNMLLVEVLPGTVTALSGISAVDRIIPNFRVTAAEPDAAPEDDRPGTATVEDRTWGVDRIRAHRVWSEIGVDGTGVRVATLDTGVNITHPDLAGKMATDDPSDPTFPGGWMEFDA